MRTAYIYSSWIYVSDIINVTAQLGALVMDQPGSAGCAECSGVTVWLDCLCYSRRHQLLIDEQGFSAATGELLQQQPALQAAAAQQPQLVQYHHQLMKPQHAMQQERYSMIGQQEQPPSTTPIRAYTFFCFTLIITTLTYYLCINHGDQGFLQFQTITDGPVTSSRFIYLCYGSMAITNLWFF